MGDIIKFQMNPGEVSGAPYCTFGLFEGISQATFRNISVESNVPSSNGARLSLQFQNAALDHFILVD
jgi:hypothetical protein